VSRMNSTGLTVYGGWTAHGVADFSPFCLKLKTYLRMTGVPYVSKLGDPRKAPTGKIPYIDDGGTLLGDSGHILEYLKKKHGDPLDEKLGADDHALGHLVRRTVEENLYWAAAYTRWADDDAFAEVKKLLVPLLPPVIGGFIASGPIRSGVRKGVYAQGIGRHTASEIHRIGCADVDAVATVLGKKTYLLGDAPSSYDAVFYGFLANVMAFPPASPIAVHARSHANLASYVERMSAAYWATPDAS
jgi:glutathione S-transferase